MSKSKGIIFDLDGVIVDTARFHFLAWRKLARELGIDFSELQNEELKGLSRSHSLQKILGWGKKTVSDEDFERYMTMKNEDYLASISSMTKDDLLPGVRAVLDYLTENKIPYALGSASKNAPAILKYLDIYDRFEAIVDGNNVQKPKPNPEVFLSGAKALGKAPEDCVVFEDAQAGIQAAISAGMISIGIGDKKILGEADYNFSDFTEITPVFLKELVTIQTK